MLIGLCAAILVAGAMYLAPSILVSVLIAALTICQKFPKSRWVADLPPGRDPAPA